MKMMRWCDLVSGSNAYQRIMRFKLQWLKTWEPKDRVMHLRSSITCTCVLGMTYYHTANFMCDMYLEILLVCHLCKTHVLNNVKNGHISHFLPISDTILNLIAVQRGISIIKTGYFSIYNILFNYSTCIKYQ